MKGEGRFDLDAQTADLLDRHRLEHHHLGLEIAEDLDAFRVALVGVARRHSGATIARRAPCGR
jgi:hypothetical protein